MCGVRRNGRRLEDAPPLAKSGGCPISSGSARHFTPQKEPVSVTIAASASFKHDQVVAVGGCPESCPASFEPPNHRSGSRATISLLSPIAWSREVLGWSPALFCNALQIGAPFRLEPETEVWDATTAKDRDWSLSRAPAPRGNVGPSSPFCRDMTDADQGDHA